MNRGSRHARRRPALVQGRDHLRGARPRLLRQRTATASATFRGLTQKLDYLQDLGVTAHLAAALLSFAAARTTATTSPTTRNIHPHYGTLEDFKAFLEAAHERGIRVITELVINHTSDQHPWFQRARRAPAGSPERDFYVWSDTPEKYKDARIIFKDFEPSNWSWDPVAKAYYWHRFYSHQPDLNFDNPAVWEAIFPVVDFWLDMGVDGMRLDAVPYLYEREGTELREPARDARVPQGPAHARRRAVSRPDVPGRGQPVARGRRRLFRRRRRMPHGVPLPAHAAAVHGAAPGRPVPDPRHHGRRRRRSPRTASGACSCGTTTS